MSPTTRHVSMGTSLDVSANYIPMMAFEWPLQLIIITQLMISTGVETK
jgi:hypothetical protein